MTSKALAWAVAATVVATTPAFACMGKSVLFEDKFTAAEPGWELWERISIGGGALRIRTDPGYIAPVFYKADVYDKADICFDLTIPSLTDPEKPLAGLLFSAVDLGNFYYFWFNPTGAIGVSRLFNKRWLSPVQPRKVEGINTASGAKNTFRLTLNGGAATVYANGEKIVDFRINATPGGGFIGFNADGGAVEGETWVFGNLKVTDLPQ
jgi:hypothetical protein